jgi:hypothetical protein
MWREVSTGRREERGRHSIWDTTPTKLTRQEYKQVIHKPDFFRPGRGYENKTKANQATL